MKRGQEKQASDKGGKRSRPVMASHKSRIESGGGIAGVKNKKGDGQKSTGMHQSLLDTGERGG